MSTATMWRKPKGHVIVDQVPRAAQTWDTASAMMEAVRSLVPDDELAATVVLFNESRANREARRAFQEVGEITFACVAMVVQSRVAELTGNFFLRLNSPSFPTRLFHEREDAVAWVQQYVGTKRPD